MVYDWTKMSVVPRGGLEFWGQYEAGVSADGTMNDYSGNARHLTQSSNKPVLTSNVLAGQPGWYFNGSKSPLQWASGGVSVKHAFVLASCDESTFTTYRGLMSGTSLEDVLLTNNSGTTMFNTSATTYRKSDVLYAAASQQAPVGGAFAVLEVSYAAGVGLVGLQLGDQRNLSRPWKGYIFEAFAYSTVKNDYERWMLYRYFAMRYNLWQKSSLGLNIFPFVNNKARSSELDQENYLSQPYSGDPKALVRGNDKRAFSVPFTNRIQPEYEAAEIFHRAHYPLTHMIYRDYRFNPPRDSECRMTSPLREQGSDVTARFNYYLDFAETS